MHESSLYTGLFVSITLLTLLGSGLWVWASLLLTGLLTLALFTQVSVIPLSATLAWGSINSYSLVSLPLFVLMGEILLRSGISNRMFKALNPWTERIPGGLLHTNVVASTLFAAVSGSSAATVATIGKITLPELEARGYDPKLAIGSLAGAGTLGFLIPPSMVLIIYGVMAEVSIGKLFIAGILPGILLALSFSLWIAARHLWATRKKAAIKNYPPINWQTAGRSFVELVPILLLITAVMGSIYTGVATATESAAVGVLGAILLGFAGKELDFKSLVTAGSDALHTSTMIGMILMGAAVLSTAVELTGIPKDMAAGVAAAGLGPVATMILLGMVYLLLGMFLDGISMIVVTLPVALPIVIQAGYSPLWFGIFIVLLIELAQITPPVGFNLFVLQALSGRSIFWIARAASPFFLILVLFAILITLAPTLVTMFVPDI